LVSLLAYPLVAMAGAIAGAFTHEATHALVATVVGDVKGVGWQGGLAGGPYVDFRAPSRWRSEAVRKAPLVAGVIALAIVVVTYPGPTLDWVAAAAFALGLLWTSPEDLFGARATASVCADESS